MFPDFVATKMDSETTLQALLTSIKEALSSRNRQDDMALPTFDPAVTDTGAAAWCADVEKFGVECGWSGLTKIAKAGKALKGSALSWYESWQPQQGRSWEDFCVELSSLYPENKNLSERLYKATVYSSDSAESYCEYAREKIRLLKNTKISFSESQLIEIVCGGIRDNNVKMASFNSSVKTTSELISMFSAYVKPKKRSVDQSFEESPGPSKRFKPMAKPAEFNDKKCFTCGEKGHVRTLCTKTRQSTSLPKELKQCTVCKKMGHDATRCFFNREELQIKTENNK